MAVSEPRASDDSKRNAWITRIVEVVIRLRAAGESIEDSRIIEAYPTLAPGLAQRLAALHKVEEARKEA